MDKYFIIGSPYFIDKNIKNLASDDEDADTETFFGDELNKQEFFGYINSVNIFGGIKTAIVRNAAKIKDLDAFAEILSKCTESRLIITTEGADKQNIKLVKIFQKNGFSVLEEQSKNKKAAPYDVVKIFEDKNIKINYNQAELILAAGMNNLSMAENEAEKISIYADYLGGNFNSANIMEYISGEKEDTIFELADAFGERDLRKALSIYKTLPDNNDSGFKIFFALSKRICQIYTVFINPSLLDVKYDFQRNNIMKQKSKWTRLEAAKALGYFASLDKDIKSGVQSIGCAIENALLFTHKDNVNGYI